MARRVMRYSSGQWPQHEGAIRVLEAYLAHAALLVPLDELSAVMVAVMVEETVAEKVELETGGGDGGGDGGGNGGGDGGRGFCGDGSAVMMAAVTRRQW